MNILILNGSPKGKNSVTLQTALYLAALHPEHNFTVLNVGQKIKAYEKDFSEARRELEAAELIIFCYPVYTFIAPSQLHRFIELIYENGVDLSGKISSQITTSKHFYDVTAHRFIEENCHDLNLNVVRGLSADMDDLLSDKGQLEARQYFDQLMFCVRHGIFEPKPLRAENDNNTGIYACSVAPVKKLPGKRVVIVTALSDDENLANMIADFRAALPCESSVVNLRETRIDGGCLGCFGCAVTGKCVYKDNFDEFLRGEIQTADAIVYAFTIKHHYADSILKRYDDRQFCNGHRTVTAGTPIAYIISGGYRYEHNLRDIVEARSEVGGNYLCGVATDEYDTEKALRDLAANLTFALKYRPSRPANFFGVGGMKIFRDLIYVMQGLMKADHKFYKEHGIYDFPQKEKKRIIQMKLVGSLISIPSVQAKMKGQMNDFIIGPYRKVIESAQCRHAPAGDCQG